MIDFNNTSGFFNDTVPPESRIVAIYTLNVPDLQDQHLAYSSDGINFTKYNQSVLSINSTQFRDPKVFWDEGQSQWVMTVAHPQEYAVVFYGSPNLKDWTELSRLSTAGILGYQYECPDLLQVPVEGGPRDGEKEWVLIVSINPGAPVGGSVVEYFVGDWDGKTFTPRDGAARIADFAKDFYAAQSWSNTPDGKAIAVGWASNWQYTNVVPTSPFRSIQSVPRELTLKYYRPNPMFGDYVLNSRPVEQFESIVGETLYSFAEDNASDKASTNKTVELRGSGGFDINATFRVPADANVTYNSIGSFKISSSAGDEESVSAGIQMGEPAVMYIDRGLAGREFGAPNPFFTDKTSGIIRYQANYTSEQAVLGPLPAEAMAAQDGDKLISLRAIVDRSVIEVFANGGEVSGTSVFFFSNDGVPARLDVSIGDDVVKLEDLTVRAVDSTWPDCA